MNPNDSLVNGRTASFSRNDGLEALLKDINSLLWAAEEKAIANSGVAELPLVLVVGPMRSGTTLFMQWLANTGLFAYPTNLLSRFYQAPIVGAKIQLLLTDSRYNFRDELGEFAQQTGYNSENGKTKGALAPNEFWYFWRRFLAETNRDVWTDEELRQNMDTQTMLAELAGISSVFQKPFAAKAMLFNYNIPFLDSIIEKVLFVHIKRDLVSNVASVIDARKRQFGSHKHWYSFKIPEYEELIDLDPISQAAGQVCYINRAVSHGFSKVDSSRKMSISYESFCENPKLFHEELIEKINMLESGYAGPQNFETSRRGKISQRDKIETAVSRFSCS